ncbi:MAG: hypothetical protein JWN02_2132 [Acidobacteria bacterium]|nr:hypothetical protein [Acidobacteriota bacterium]
MPCRPPLLSLLAAALLLAATPARAGVPEQMRKVEQIRGLTFTGPVKTEELDRGELPQRLEAQLVKTMPYSLDDYVTVLEALQLLDPGTKNVLPKLFGFLQQQVLAFYDPLTKTYYSVRQLPEGLAGLGQQREMLEEGVAMHELTHALQDQRFGIGVHDYALRDDQDAGMADHERVEGEATLVMMASMMGGMGKSLDQVLADETLSKAISDAAASADQTAEGASAPPRYFVESLKFPYVEGLKLVIAAYRRGGWKELDRVYGNPPASTREVLHLSVYFARLDRGLPSPAIDAASPALASHVLSVEHLGEFTWGYLVGAENARGLVSDHATVTQNAACEAAVQVETRWESAAGAGRFADAYRRFLEGRGVPVRITVDGTTVRASYGAR